jgi:putative tricarboxylic transport membrane protein
MRRAEIVMALVMAAFSVYLMWKSAELPVGWIKGEGPGGGAWPFWLAAIMLGSCIFIIVNWFRRASPPSRSEEVYMDSHAIRSFLMVGGGLTAAIGLIHVIGVYGSVFLFLLYYIRFLGKHSWRTTAAIAVTTPVVTFFFFDVALRIVLPKGYTEPLFIPLYDIFL